MIWGCERSRGPTWREGMPYTNAILQSGNLFVFGLNNPVMFIDPSGEFVKLAPLVPIVVECFKRAAPHIKKGFDAVVSGVQRVGNAIGNFFRGGNTVQKIQPGRLTGNLNSATAAERKVINDLLARGKNVEVVARSTGKTFDFRINGISTELKTLQNANVNTGITRIKQGFAQNNPSAVIIDARGTGLTISQAKEMIQRAAGTYLNKILPGHVQVWTDSGIVSGGG